ncbi:hypothetical protein MHH52_14520 [Paenibacillus sp. FSL K6-0276]|uniref:hypothetical protein n=1 Tax=unclassified Paenibacillus TaxID=185978 RepID=UPI0028AF3D0D|nr:hypothetical protein [Paenibacillus sp.]
MRELTLREIADVDERLEAWDRDESLCGPWRRRKVIFVCIRYGLQIRTINPVRVSHCPSVNYLLRNARHMDILIMVDFDPDIIDQVL